MPEVTIVQLTTVHPRGDTRIFYREVRALAKFRGTDLRLVVADGEGSSPHFIDGAAISLEDLGRYEGNRIGRVVVGSYRAFLAIRDIRPKIVHFHDPELIPLGLVLRIFGCKVVYDVHEDVPRQVLSKHWIPRLLRYPAAWIVAVLEWLGGRAFDALVAATPLIARRFPRNKTIVVQNFPVLSELAAAESKPYPERRNGFVYIGALSPERGLKEVVAAAGALDPVYEAHLSLAGEFRPSTLENELRAMRAWNTVEYHGWAPREKVAELLGQARAGLVVLHPIKNYLDAYPVKMFEYMAAGLPVIASDFPLWREIVGQAACGILVDPLNPEEIKEAMQWILDHPDESLEMGRNGAEAVLSSYNWDSEAQRLTDLYCNLLRTE